MKNYFLNYNKITGTYIFHQGKDSTHEKDREEFHLTEPSKLIKKLNTNINPKRKSQLYINKNLSQEIKDKIKTHFKDSKVSIEYKTFK